MTFDLQFYVSLNLSFEDASNYTFFETLWQDKQ